MIGSSSDAETLGEQKLLAQKQEEAGRSMIDVCGLKEIRIHTIYILVQENTYFSHNEGLHTYSCVRRRLT